MHATACGKRIQSLDNKLKLGVRRVLEAPDDIAGMLSEELSNMKRDRTRLAERLSTIDNVAPMEKIDEMVEATADRLWSLTDDLENIEPCSLRALLNEMVCRIDLHFDHI